MTNELSILALDRELQALSPSDRVEYISWLYTTVGSGLVPDIVFASHAAKCLALHKVRENKPPLEVA